MSRRKLNKGMIAGIDIGSTSIRLAIGQLNAVSDFDYNLQIIGAVEVPSEGVQKGVITSIEDTISAISNVLERGEQIIGVPIEHLWVGVSGNNILLQESRGVVAVSRGNGEISSDDVERAVEAARAVATPLNYEILHVLPQGFTVDSQTGIKDPIGMTGMRLEVDTKIIHVLNSHLKNLTKCVYRTGLDIDDFVFSILAAAESVTTPKQRDLGVVVVNLGGYTTSLVVYEGGDMIQTAVIPIGSAHITNDLALGLKTSIEIAELVKREYGYCLSAEINRRDFVDLMELGAERSEKFFRRYIAEIIEARVGEILEKIDEKLSDIDRSGLLPAGAIFIGGGAKIKGLTELAKIGLSLPTTLGRVVNVSSISDQADDLGFVPAVGLIKWGAKNNNFSGRRSILSNIGGRAVDGIKKVFKVFIP